MSKVRVTLNYVDLAWAIQKVRSSETLEEACNNVEVIDSILNEASKQEDAEFIKSEVCECPSKRSNS